MQERRTVETLSPRAVRLLAASVVVGAVVAADQVTTSLAVDHLRRPVHVIGPFGLDLQYNSGSAFSLFTGAAPVLTVVVIVLIAGLGWLVWRARTTVMAIALGLVVGGALGNLADRLLRGHHGDVVDFITLTHWPTFNVADACITVGVVVAAVLFLRGPPSTRRVTTAEGDRGGHPEQRSHVAGGERECGARR